MTDCGSLDRDEGKGGVGGGGRGSESPVYYVNPIVLKAQICTNVAEPPHCTPTGSKAKQPSVKTRFVIPLPFPDEIHDGGGGGGGGGGGDSDGAGRQEMECPSLFFLFPFHPLVRRRFNV